ncbi:MAG: zinc-dependent alcohol dehydrogenase family protein, partial [Pseudomonadales bacterium]|nr:zinc-dependent alcohol dehydrogenase family protein [Pseudomonadales bacterium]
VPMPVPAPLEVRIRVCACGVCHTELDEIEGRTPPPTFPMIPGHQVVGEIDAVGDKVTTRRIGERVGVGWIYSACGDCEFCRSGDENLCPEFVATGRDRNGGYAEYLCVPASFAIPLPEVLDDLSAAPLLCAGAIGYRSLALTGLADGQRLGLTGFGASAHLVLKLVRHLYPKTDVYVFARSAQEQSFALELGATWAGATEQTPPARLHAIIDTTPAWLPVLSALRALLPRGRLVINAIRKEPGDIDSWRALDYPEHLWMEKEIKSVANVTRKDIATFLEHAATIGIEPTVQTYSLEEANKALVEMKRGAIRGARVLRISQGPTRPHAP